MLMPGFARLDLERSATPADLSRGGNLPGRLRTWTGTSIRCGGACPVKGSPPASCCSTTARGT
jgi:hypothetical protein